MIYSLHNNWAGLTHPLLVDMFPVPQRYYVPGRIRETFRPRLEAAGLWNLPGIEPESPKAFRTDSQKQQNSPTNNKETFVRVFEREKVIGKARSSLDIYARLLGDQTYFYGTR